ncbi:MAG: branched-chain-amino-acid transaminase [Clostridia bacterium]|nr:branched-chain-amino-acid transaminase [Clostridia bacterium]
MADIVFLDGQLVPAREAKVSVYDHGFLYGDGIFDTIRAYGGRFLRLGEHLDRLFAHGEAIGLNIPWTREYLADALGETLAANGMTDAYLRLSISRGPGPIGIDPGLCPQPTLVIMAKALAIDNETYEKGIEVISLQTRRNPIECTDPRIKSFNFLNNIMAKLELIKAGAKEGIMLNYQHWVAEATVSNIFFIKNGVLKTPAVEVGILPGITRQVVLELAAKQGIPVEEGFFPLDEVHGAQEVFLTNSISELVPVVKVDRCTIGSGRPGEVTLRLLQSYRALINS